MTESHPAFDADRPGVRRLACAGSARGRGAGCAIVAAALLVPSLAGAQRAAPRVWTEASAVSRATVRAPEVQAARYALETARSLRAYAGVPLVGNPVVGVRAMLGLPGGPASSSYNLTVAVPIDVSGQRPRFAREAQWAAREAEARLDVAVNDAGARARAGYVELAAADAIIRVASDRVEGAREVLGRARAAADRGAATALDVALAARELAEASADLAAARRDRHEAAGRFREAVDLRSTDAAAVTPLAEPALPGGLTRELAVRLAVERRREATAAHAGARRLVESAGRARAQYIGPLWLGAETTVGVSQPAQSAQSAAGVSLQWALPLLHTGQGERAHAQAQAVAAEADGVRAERRADREAGTAWDVLVERLAELQALRADAIPALEQTLHATERLLDAGATDFFRVLYARRELALVRARAAAVAREAWRAGVALERAMGARTADQDAHATRPGGQV